ncbi:MAG: 16S rRNA methyltransferase [Metallosphaera sp.]
MDIILIESSLELVPEQIRYHPSVVKNALKVGKDPSKVLLDISLHYHAMRDLPNREKRGRPDIVHTVLTMVLTDPEFRGEVLIHTVDSRIIKVSRKMRPPKNYLRFVGLMEQLLVYGRVPLEGDPLMEVSTLTLEEVIRDRGLILLDEKGQRINPSSLCNSKEFIGVGAFPHGDFDPEVRKLSGSSLSISDKTLETQHVVCRLISSCAQG